MGDHLERIRVFEFEWDPAKATSNLRKHKVGFELAATVFLDRFAMSVRDEYSSVFEERWITMGMAEDRRLLVVCHTFADEMLVRIISARLATQKERRQYEAGE